ncbi:MAG TPA: phosphate ABC transporter permease PstA [Candidatus Binatia bacterium]|nr:phosphate ABC transporter permease PstA [Candidatus Binatia bacterium]
MSLADSRDARASMRAAPSPLAAAAATRRRTRATTLTLQASGEPMLWLTAGALATALLMIVGLLALVLAHGTGTFWPSPVVRIQTTDGRLLAGEVTRSQHYRPAAAVIDALPETARAHARSLLAAGEGASRRRLVRIGNYELTGEHFAWVSDFEVARQTLPPWALVIERRTWGRFYGEPAAFHIDGAPVATEVAEIWQRYQEAIGAVQERWHRRRRLETHDVGLVNRRLEAGRLRIRSAEMAHGRSSPQRAQAESGFAAEQAQATAQFERIREEIRALDVENARYALRMRTADGQETTIALADIVRAYRANSLGIAGSLQLYLARWWEFLTDEPREANSEGGVFPAIFGTVAMTLIMSLLVTPFGVLAALYLREYARGGIATSTVRIAINNLAGVPSIVFGVFGLGFFCYIVGAGLDQLLYAEKLPTPTFGTGGILWASLTLALLTLPVVIVATEEALAAVPKSMREGSYACGASKWQTIQRIVLPRALPGIMTGMILAIARGAGEVAPLMLVGAVKLAPELPIDATSPFLHLERSFMHLGFHIYDLGFQSQNSEAAKPMVFTTTLLLIGIVASLNLMAIWLRARLRRRFVTSHF